MIIEIFVLKLLITVLTVLLLSIIAEKVSPKVAGIISGYPTGTAISLFFFGFEISSEFASQSAVHNMLGQTAALVFLYLYYKSSVLFTKRTVVYSSVVSVLGYLMSIYLLNLLKIDIIGAFLITLSAIVISTYLFKEIKDVVLQKIVKLNTTTLILRGLIASSIILFITEIAKFVGTEWAGLFSAFPTTVFPLILIIHLTYGKEQVHSIIKNNPRGNIALVFYSLSVAIFYPVYGIYAGTFVALVFAVFVSVVHEFIRITVAKKASN